MSERNEALRHLDKVTQLLEVCIVLLLHVCVQPRNGSKALLLCPQASEKRVVAAQADHDGLLSKRMPLVTPAAPQLDVQPAPACAERLPVPHTRRCGLQVSSWP